MFFGDAVFTKFIFLLYFKVEVSTVIVKYMFLSLYNGLGVHVKLFLYQVIFLCNNFKSAINLMKFKVSLL